jgi:hypothetical protein
MKARAFRNRGKEKDAYDLVYVLQHYSGGIGQVAEALKPLLDDPDAQEAMAWLTEDFLTLDSPGPVRTALFRHGLRDDELQADARGLVQELVSLVG